ncbi:hypothetical protein GXP67_15610 [Rhodocytophaga rosea]|uniref:SRPBCC family protein n=1 Tax=Rhodocytophaga rosea TaxID=2704465 RepID=A0A6C0GJ26_9BACT|nr:hypothetical protein [Rhodocytophaga rosea]QHT67965.1 hypothetical protein GXP67_15610 [Rhodocytophaga rosea]
MRFIIITPVAMDYQQVAQNFGKSLFQALNPPFPPVKLLRFDGNAKGDEVHLELNFIIFKQVWKSLITENNTNSKEIYFVDEGIQLPFFLKYWRHKHRIVNKSSGAAIIDDITFRSSFFLFDFLLYPVLYLQFLYRKPVYKKIFQKKRSNNS